MKRSDRRDEFVVPVLCLVLFVSLGLSVAERGLCELLDLSEPFLLDASIKGNGRVSLTLWGHKANLNTMIVLADFHATPTEIVISNARGAGRQRRIAIGLRFSLPGSDRALAYARTFVSGASEFGFSATRAIYNWWESRLDNR